MALIPDQPRQRNALIVGILVAAGFYFFWAYWYSPRSIEVTEMESRLEQLESQNNRAQIIATRGGSELQERLAQYERHVAELEQLIPQNEEVPALLNDIQAEGVRTNVEVSSLAPEPQEAGAFYTKETYSMDVVGDYHNLGRFFSSIASLPRIITPVDLELRPFEGNRAVLDQSLEYPLTGRLRIQTYILPASEPPPEEGGEGQEGG
jgi:type IV pilus assembly protein PilO